MRGPCRSAAVVIVAWSLVGCQARSLHYTPFGPIEQEATDITLDVYSDGWGTLVQTMEHVSEGAVLIDPEVNTAYQLPESYYIYARADGYYTELYYCDQGDVIDVDLDAVPELPGALAGVVIVARELYAHEYLADYELEITGPGLLPATVTTDWQGRYGLADLPEGTYTLSFTYDGEPYRFTLENGPGTDYQDLVFYAPMQARAPNLYLYPARETDVSVRLGFPVGGQVIESAPPYPAGGWQVRVAPDGTIDGEHPYLFYEARLPEQLQTREGWLLDGRDLDRELRALLSRLGFVGREIDDFVEIWVPWFAGAPWLAVYPQDADSLVTLDIAPAPLAVRRAWLLIRAVANPQSLPAPPVAPPFARRGFVAAEWGVITGE